MKWISACLITLTTSTVVLAARPTVGDAAPDWQYLQGTDGKLHSSSDYKDAKVVVVVFLCNKCPCARGYDGRFRQFAEKYGPHGVRLVAINANVGGIETMDGMKQRAASGRYNFPYLRDASQQVARGFGAMSTPHAFVLDQNRNIAYMGAFDDNRNPSLVKHHFVPDAVNALLAGQDVPVKVSKQFGCAINYQ